MSRRRRDDDSSYFLFLFLSVLFSCIVCLSEEGEDCLMGVSTILIDVENHVHVYCHFCSSAVRL